MIVQKDIAAKLGISRSAVSAILQGGERAEKFRPEMRQRVLEAAAKYGYQRNELAHAIRSGHNCMIGFVTQNITHPHVGLLLNGVLEAANDHDYAVRILNKDTYGTPELLLRQVIGQCLAGIVVYDISDALFLTGLYDLLQKEGIPIVYAGGSSPLHRGVRIESDVEQGGKLAFDHLYSLGHRDFLLAAAYDWADYSQKLIQGFLTQARQAPEPVRCLQLTAPNKVNAQDAVRAVADYNLTACLCNTTDLTLSLLSCLQNQGIKVPQKVSVMGRGNIEYCKSMIPTMTMLDEGLEDIGKQATEALLNTLRQKAVADRLVKIPHRIVQRESTARLE